MRSLKSLYLRNRLFYAITAIVVLFIISFFVPGLIILPKALVFLLLAVMLTDLLLLYRTRTGMRGHRYTPDKLSNGDHNDINILVENYYPFTVSLTIVDEIPHQFQRRDIAFRVMVKPSESRIIPYSLRPVKRGEYSFGAVNIFASSPLALFSRRFRFSADKMVPVYPSYQQMRKYELLAISNNLTEVGIKKIRRIGNNQEFELIRDYISGDDYRTINWKASARKSHFMVNQYQDEKSQQVYSLIDKGRVMQMPFEGMSLLDYAINASLVISNIAIHKSDKAGLVTFQDRIGSMLSASRTSGQMQRILEVLYNQKTAYRESDFATLFNLIKNKITHRSLLLLFTNFESNVSLERQLPYLKAMARHHLLVVIFFENTEMSNFIKSPAKDLREVYHKAIAERFTYERKLIVKELQANGIHSVLTRPEELTVNTINKYLELKARGMI